jgi:hypothetical protein
VNSSAIVRASKAPDPIFDSALHTVLEDLRQQVTASPKFDGGVAIRNAHAKGYGLARGEVEILADIPPEYAQGIYSKPGRHEAMVRFSNGQPHINSDRLLGSVCGIGLKIFGIEGRRRAASGDATATKCPSASTRRRWKTMRRREFIGLLGAGSRQGGVLLFDLPRAPGNAVRGTRSAPWFGVRTSAPKLCGSSVQRS